MRGLGELHHRIHRLLLVTTKRSEDFSDLGFVEPKGENVLQILAILLLPLLRLLPRLLLRLSPHRVPWLAPLLGCRRLVLVGREAAAQLQGVLLAM